MAGRLVQPSPGVSHFRTFGMHFGGTVHDLLHKVFRGRVVTYLLKDIAEQR